MARYLDISFGLLAFSSSLALMYGAFVESKTWISVWTLTSATVLVGCWVRNNFYWIVSLWKIAKCYKTKESSWKKLVLIVKPKNKVFLNSKQLDYFNDARILNALEARLIRTHDLLFEMKINVLYFFIQTNLNI